MNPPDDFDPDTVQPVVRRPRRDDDQVRRPARVGAAPTRPTSVRRRAAPASTRAGTPPLDEGPFDSGDAAEDDDYVVLPPSSNGGRRLLAVAGMLVLIAGILVGGVLIWASRQVDPPGDPGEVVAELVIPEGSSTEAIAGILEDADVISNARLFRYYVGWKDAGPWKAGEYIDFRRSSSFDQAIEVLDGGPVPPAATVVRVVEGRRLEDALRDIAEQMESITVEQLEQALESGLVTSRYRPAGATSWEGFLFPDTYQFSDDATAVDVLQTMATKMDEVLDDLDYDKAETLQGRPAYDLITIASLIEKETGAPEEERGMISRAISNRLDEGEFLGIDAAILYGLGRADGELTRSDLDTETPYNTRITRGLPPTAIALPGRASLAAAIAPAEGDWKYYVLVSNDPPRHFFTDSYQEFLDAKADAQERGVF